MSTSPRGSRPPKTRFAALRRQADDELIVAMAGATSPLEFSSRELWQHTRDLEELAPPLRPRFAALLPRSPGVKGKQ
jgi:hypothetical protein